MVPLLEVYDSSSGSDVRIGVARFTLRHGRVSTTFAYDDDYLTSPNAYAVDPFLPLIPTPLHCEGLPGSFRDSSPDRWGRHLIERKAHLTARERQSFAHMLDEVDYLVGVFDQAREGSLRFREPDGNFLDSSFPIPPILRLPELADSARRVTSNNDGIAQVKELLNAGSGSLGGARPKASVHDGTRLLLAKFPHPNDEWDVMAWEKTTLDMAEAAGISVPKSEIIRLGNESVLLLERFDRAYSQLDGVRIPFISGMTLLGSADGESRDYAELIEAIAGLTDNAVDQLKEVFRRVAFSVAIGNTDDHLRNWGFLRTDGSWRLSPLFDVNPNPYENAQRVTSIVGESGADEVRGLRDLAAYAGLGEEEAAMIVGEILSVAGRWKEFALRNGCPDRETKLFVPSFEKRTEALKAEFVKTA